MINSCRPRARGLLESNGREFFGRGKPSMAHPSCFCLRGGKRDEARTMLADIYNWFTEGFDTADLIDAKPCSTN
jgi:hypothetical protein